LYFELKAAAEFMLRAAEFIRIQPLALDLARGGGGGGGSLS